MVTTVELLYSTILLQIGQYFNALCGISYFSTEHPRHTDRLTYATLIAITMVTTQMTFKSILLSVF